MVFIANFHLRFGSIWIQNFRLETSLSQAEVVSVEWLLKTTGHGVSPLAIAASHSFLASGSGSLFVVVADGNVRAFALWVSWDRCWIFVQFQISGKFAFWLNIFNLSFFIPLSSDINIVYNINFLDAQFIILLSVLPQYLILGSSYIFRIIVLLPIGQVNDGWHLSVLQYVFIPLLWCELTNILNHFDAWCLLWGALLGLRVPGVYRYWYLTTWDVVTLNNWWVFKVLINQLLLCPNLNFFRIVWIWNLISRKLFLRLLVFLRIVFFYNFRQFEVLIHICLFGGLPFWRRDILRNLWLEIAITEAA